MIILQGRSRTYHAKQLAQQAVLDLTDGHPLLDQPDRGLLSHAVRRSARRAPAVPRRSRTRPRSARLATAAPRLRPLPAPALRERSWTRASIPAAAARARLVPVADRARRAAVDPVEPEPRALPPPDLAPGRVRPAAGRLRAADLARPARARPDDGRPLRRPAPPDPELSRLRRARSRGRGRSATATFTLGALIREIDRQFAPTAAARRIAWECALEGPDATVTTDASRCQQIFGNLVANALKYTPEGGEVRRRRPARGRPLARGRRRQRPGHPRRSRSPRSSSRSTGSPATSARGSRGAASAWRSAARWSTRCGARSRSARPSARGPA